jgi:hemerythrin-like domain-containing protein
MVVEEYRHDPAAGSKFVSVANQYKDHLIGHMRQEEAILFKLAEEMLDGPVKDSLTHLFAEENAETRERTQRYEQLAKELEKTRTL